jgi:proton-dependent oligopeptide transporter, POT family
MSESRDNFFKTQVLGHPAGLFVLFFTEMWERFSYYGMRALLVLFLTASLMGENPGWEWARENALALLGTYASLVYLSPILGGMIADRFLGYRLAVALGALLMTIGHASMALETEMFLYIGIGFLIFGNGFFKPNITSIISQMYEGKEDKKDGAYTIFYMGVNAGAFLGIMLCGYLGEKVGWSWGFGLAGIFMFMGMLQFWFAQPLFGDIGAKPAKLLEVVQEDALVHPSDKLNPFTTMDKIMIFISAGVGLFWIINDPLSKIGNINMFDFQLFGMDGSNLLILFALALFLVLLISRISRYTTIVRGRMIAVAIFAFFTIFFWSSFEQAAGSMSIFARDYTDRMLEGTAASAFKLIDALITVIPLLIITWVLYLLFKQTIRKITLSNVILASSFLMVWGIVFYKLYTEYSSVGTEVPATWYAILNSLFIIICAPLFAKWWESKYNPSGAFKYGFGLILLGLGFAFLAFGAITIPQGAHTAQVSMIWLIMAYLFHTLGELCLSPMGLSYLSKLVPGRMIAMMFGIWYLAIAIGNKMAHSAGGMIDKVTSEYSLSAFFMIFTLVPIFAGILIMTLNKLLKRLMHGVK